MEVWEKALYQKWQLSEIIRLVIKGRYGASQFESRPDFASYKSKTSINKYGYFWLMCYNFQRIGGGYLMGKLNKYFMPLMLLGILLLAVGCTNPEETGNSSEGSENESVDKSKEAQENVKTVLENLLNGPNEEQEKILNHGEDVEEYSENLTDYQDENFKPYMSDNFYESYIIKLNGAIDFLHVAYPVYMMKVDEIILEEREAKEGDYEFDVKVVYTNKENDESETMTLEGTASTNQEGKITSIRYMNAEEFRDALRN